MWPNSNYGFNNGGSQGNQNSPNGFNQGGPEQQYPPFFPPFYPHQFHPGGNGQLELHLSGPYGLYNNQVFLRNQMGAPQVSQNTSAGYNMRQASPLPRPPTVLEMSDRAVELKTKLIKDRERRPSFSSTAAIMSEQLPSGPGCADRSAPRPQDLLPVPAINFEQARNIDQLISQYSDLQPALNINTDKSRGNTMPLPIRLCSTSPGNSAVPLHSTADILSGASRSKDSLLNGGVNDKKTSSVQLQSGQSQGSPICPRKTLESHPKTSLAPASQLYHLPQTPQQSPTLQSLLVFRTSTRPPVPPIPPVAAMKEKSNPGFEPVTGQNRGRGPKTPSEILSTSRETQDENRNSNMTDATDKESIGDIVPPNDTRALTLPVRSLTLARLLEHDRDLYDWLTITNYFNLEHRGKVLERRREIMKLDEQRIKLLAEIESDEHPILLAPSNPLGTLPQASPSPSQNVKKELVEAQQAFSNAPSTQQVSGTQIPAQQASAEQVPSSQAPKSLASAPPLSAPRGPRNYRGRERERPGDRVVSNKRAHSEARGSHEQHDFRNKVQRTSSARPRTPIRSLSRSRSRLPRYRRAPSSYDLEHGERRRYRYVSQSRGQRRSPPRPRSPLRLRSPERGYDYGSEHGLGYDYDERARFGPYRRPRSRSPSVFGDRGRGRGHPPSPPRSYYHLRQYGPNYRPRGYGRGRPEPFSEPCPRAIATDANGMIPFESGGLATPTAPRDLESRITFTSDARRGGQ